MKPRTLAIGAGVAPPLPTGGALQSYWLNHASLGACERAQLQAFLAAGAKGLSAEALAAATGYAWSGGFRNGLSKLRTAGLIEGRNSDVMRASAHLIGD